MHTRTPVLTPEAARQMAKRRLADLEKLPDYLTDQEAADLLRLCLATVRLAIRTGELPSVGGLIPTRLLFEQLGVVFPKR